MYRICLLCLLSINVFSEPPIEAALTPAESILQAVGDAEVSQLLSAVLSDNPEIAALRAAAAAKEAKIPQVRSFPDPVAGITAFILSPETRVGPQQFMGSLSQTFPWFGKLKLREQRAIYIAAAARSAVEVKELLLLTEARKLLLEISFLDSQSDLVQQDLDTLSHFEELARVRYASGIGLQYGVLKIQSGITLSEQRLIEIRRERLRRTAAWNALASRPQGSPLFPPNPPEVKELLLDYDSAKAIALTRRPEIREKEALHLAGETAIHIAKKNFFPDITAGLTYTAVGRRHDVDPIDNGQDILGVSARITLPVFREKRRAEVEEASRLTMEAEHRLQSATIRIEAALGDITGRLPLLWREWLLFRDVLSIQSEAALESVLTAYSSGTANVLDLLDAERVLLDVRTAFLRTETDYLVAMAEVEGAMGSPVTSTNGGIRDEK